MNQHFSIDKLSIFTRKRSKRKNTNARQAIVHEISLTCNKGETTAILGASGSGKSTLLSFLSGRLGANHYYESSVDSITYAENNIDPKELGALSYFIPCHSELLPFLNAFQSVTIEEGLRGGSRRTSSELQSILKSVGIPINSMKHSVNGYLTYPLSEAELRKLGLAMSVTANAQIVLFDEPTSFVSEANGIDILNFITETTRSRGNASIITLHQPTRQQLLQLDQLIILTPDGRLAFRGTPAEIQEYVEKRPNDPVTKYITDVLGGALLSDESDTSGSESFDDDLFNKISSELKPRCSTALERRHAHQRWLDQQYGRITTPDRSSMILSKSSRKKQKKFSVWLSEIKIWTLLSRTFFFRLQNPIVIAAVTFVMTIMACLFGAVFYNVRASIEETAINDVIDLPEITIPSIPDDAANLISSWMTSFQSGFGPELRHPFEETLFPSTKNQASDTGVLKDSRLLQDTFDSMMNVSFCSSYYWRIVDRWPDDYSEVVDGTYRLMMKENNDADSRVIPNVPISNYIEYPMDGMAMTLHELLVSIDYLLKRSGLNQTIDVCLERNDNALFWLCAKSILPQVDGLLACSGLPPFNPNHNMNSPWQLPIDQNKSDSTGYTTPTTTEEKGLNPIQLLLKPIMGGISLGAGLVFILAVVAFGMFPIIINYWLERESANRDTIALSYSTGVFFLAKTLADFLFDMPPVLLLSIIFSALIALSGYEFLIVQLMVIGVCWAHGSFAYLFTALSRSRNVAMSLFSCWTFISLLFSGFMLRVGDMPRWCSWWRYFSALYWSYGGCVCVFFKPNDDGFSLSQLILVALGVTDEAQTSIVTCCSALFVIGLVVRILACLVQVTLHRDIGTQSDYYSL